MHSYVFLGFRENDCTEEGIHATLLVHAINPSEELIEMQLGDATAGTDAVHPIPKNTVGQSRDLAHARPEESLRHISETQPPLDLLEVGRAGHLGSFLAQILSNAHNRFAGLSHARLDWCSCKVHQARARGHPIGVKPR